jgi:AraC-like DNA-binding protein
MKPALQKSPISSNQSFEIRHLSAPHFDPNWHFHSEYQLFTVLQGTGTRFIGDHVSPFRENDLVFTGPNVPHLWQSDPEFFTSDKQYWTEGIVIYFHENFIGSDFLNKHEAYKIKHLFLRCQRGIEVTGHAADEARQLMNDLLAAEDLDRIIKLLMLLDLLANCSDYKLLASEGYANQLEEAESDRMNQVHAYVMKNFRERISLEDVSSIANMSPTSFSRYFKVHANKTFSDFVTEIRIGYACKLLVSKKVSVSEACYESGFNTLSNFNRQFLHVTQHTPRQYRKKFIETMPGV